jgi:type IV/VI secretion system ImpK/VasF family protein
MALHNCPSIDRVVSYGMRLADSLDRDGQHDFDREQAVLTNLLLAVGDDDTRHDDTHQLGARYALTCWLDELFTCHSPWAEAWNETKLETKLYGGNDRAWRFWQEAKQAETLRDENLLAVYYLCVALGFRGRLRDDHEALETWMDRIRVRVTHVGPQTPAHDVLAQLRGATRHLHGRRRLSRALVAAGIALLCVLPITTFALVQKLCG